MALNQIDDIWTEYVNIRMSRDAAKRLREKVISFNGKTVVNSQLLKKIKRYSKKAYGSTAYWPWLALYTEMRGEFKEGWIPDDYYRFELLPRINPEKFIRFSEAKTIDHKLFEGLIVDPLVFRSNGQYYNREGNPHTKLEVQSFLSGINDEIIIKPDDGHGGEDIIFKHANELRLDELPEGPNLLFQRVVTQHPELSKLYPHSINTFRVLSYLNSDGDVEVKFIIIRFGMDGSRVDNTARGGGWMFVGLDGKPAPMGYDGFGFPIGTQHPDTGTAFADLELPFVSEIIAFCKKAHRNFPYTRIIGWDVFVDENEEPKLIEWNANNPNWNVIEARFGPFLKELVTDKLTSSNFE